MHISHAAHDLPPPSVLGSRGWVQWVKEVSGLRPEVVKYASHDNEFPRITGTAFFDRKGRFRHPKFGPYLGLTYAPGPSHQTEKLYRQWVLVADLLAADIVSRGIIGSVALPPGMLDARPFQWAGLSTQLRYTFASTLPADSSQFKSSVQKQVRKATRNGFVAERSDDWDSIMRCLIATEGAKKFEHHLDARALRRAHEIMGAETFRGHVVKDPRGTVVSGGVRLHIAGSTAIDWLQGTIREQLSEGVNQLMYSFVLDDLGAAGASGFDFGGANIQPVAAAKAAWGIPLVPYLLVGGFDARNAYSTARATRDWMRRSRVQTRRP